MAKKKKERMMGSANSVESITSQYPAPRKAQNLDSVKGFRNASGENSPHTTLVKKQHSKSVDPYAQPMGRRSNVSYERGGAKYGVPVRFQAMTAPEAGATQANGRIFKPALKRQAPNFQMGSMDLN